MNNVATIQICAHAELPENHERNASHMVRSIGTKCPPKLRILGIAKLNCR